MQLRGEKVLLRASEPEDVPRWHELSRSVPLVMLGDGTWYPESLARLTYWYQKDRDEQDEPDFSIVVDGKVIGGVGLHHSNRLAGTTAFGIGIFDEAYVGQGYGRDALRVFLDWAFNVQNWRRIWLTTSGTNERAQRAYRSLGFVDEGCRRQADYSDGMYEDEVIMGLLRQEWQARNTRE